MKNKYKKYPDMGIKKSKKHECKLDPIRLSEVCEKLIRAESTLHDRTKRGSVKNYTGETVKPKQKVRSLHPKITENQRQQHTAV